MNLETLLDERLWKAIESNYINRNFTGAIQDAIYFLSNLIRERSGLESDGVTLVGGAFGGKSPLLKVNKLETESDLNFQKGIEQLLRGIYQAIRNPRSHEKHADEKKDADAIICFINYLVRIIDQSKPPFTLGSYLESVFDPSFVKKDRYAKLLVDKIPKGKRYEVFVEAFRKKETGDGQKLRYFFNALSKSLTEEEVKKAAEIISDELKTSNDELSIRLTIQCLPHEWWELYDEMARLRIENKVIESIRGGMYSSSESKCLGGFLGAWANRIHRYFISKDDLVRELRSKLASNSKLESDYIFQYFFDSLIDLERTPSPRTFIVISTGLKKGDKRFYSALLPVMLGDESHPWKSRFQALYDSFAEAEPTYLDDDVPF
jgi:uncharacterized protein (TIGR02391 family)